MDEPRKRIAGMQSGLDIHYDLGEGHPLLGRHMPDLELVTADGPLRVFSLLHDARPVLLNLGEPGGFDITPWLDRVQLIDAKYDGAWELPVIGAVTGPTAVLIRPDGYVAWVGDQTQVGLVDALPPSEAPKESTLFFTDVSRGDFPFYLLFSQCNIEEALDCVFPDGSGVHSGIDC